MDRHFCVTVYVVQPVTKLFLMVHHRKLGKWVPPGGHVDPNEAPDTSAIRETLEETGIAVKLVGRTNPAESCLVQPYGLQLNVIKAHEHEHMDFIYAAVAVSGDKLMLNERESLGIGWFSAEEINAEDFVTFDSVRQWTAYFAKELIES